MAIRSSHARRKGTGRKARKRRIARIRVHKHTHRRYAGIRRRSGGAARKPRKPRPSKTGRHRRFFGRKKSTTPRAKRGQGKKYVKKGRHGPRKKGLHRRFFGRKKSLHKRVVKPGLHRRYFGRKPRASAALRKKQTAITTISSANYINMF